MYRVLIDSCGELFPEMLSDPDHFASIPLTLEVDGEDIIDDDTFDQASFLSKVKASPTGPKSACPSPDAYIREFKNADHIYIITLSSKLSGSYNSACLAEDIQSRTEIQMVGVAQNDLCLYLFAKLGEMHCLHASHRTDGHEDRGLDLTVIGGDQSCTGVTRIVAMLYLEPHAYFCFFSSSGMVKSSGCATISLVSAKFHTSCTFST